MRNHTNAQSAKNAFLWNVPRCSFLQTHLGKDLSSVQNVINHLAIKKRSRCAYVFTTGRNYINAHNVIKDSLEMITWCSTWDINSTNHFSVKCAGKPLWTRLIYKDTCEHIPTKNSTNVMSVVRHLLNQDIWYRIEESTEAINHISVQYA